MVSDGIWGFEASMLRFAASMSHGLDFYIGTR
jgi:hypothetical protein